MAEAGVRLLNTYPDSISARKETIFRFLDDWCRLLRGEIQASITRLCDYIALRMMGKSESMYGAHAFTILVEAYRQANDYEQGLRAVAEGLSLLGGSQGYWHVAELYRLKGELLIGQGGQGTDAEACFQQALEIAQRQAAKSLELRAAMGLSRLWAQQGKQREAHAVLAEVYNWFAEGFDTPDLLDASALLAELV